MILFCKFPYMYGDCILSFPCLDIKLFLFFYIFVQYFERFVGKNKLSPFCWENFLSLSSDIFNSLYIIKFHLFNFFLLQILFILFFLLYLIFNFCMNITVQSIQLKDVKYEKCIKCSNELQQNIYESVYEFAYNKQA